MWNPSDSKINNMNVTDVTRCKRRSAAAQAAVNYRLIDSRLVQLSWISLILNKILMWFS